MEFTTIRFQQDGPLAYLELNRPDKANAIDDRMWQELRAAMQWVDRTEAVRVAVLSGAGRHFCAGIDLSMLDALQRFAAVECRGRGAEQVRLMSLTCKTRSAPSSVAASRSLRVSTAHVSAAVSISPAPVICATAAPMPTSR